MTLTSAIAQLASAAEACAQAARADASAVSDSVLLDQQRQLAASARLIDMTAATLAAQVKERSRPELGYDGLAQRLGARTPEHLVQIVTGTSKQTSGRLVRVGSLVATAVAHESDPTVSVAEPWLAPVLRAAVSGVVSSEAVEVIKLGLGNPTESVTVDALTAAAENLTSLATTLTLDLLAARVRELRDELDAAGVAEREEERRDRRYLHLTPQADGMTRISGLLDPESAAVIKNAVDAATSPARGGPRFVKAEDRARAEALEGDPRKPEQLAVDALVELVDIAVRAAGSTILGVRRADVRLLATFRDLKSGDGVGFIEGQSAAVSIATVQRHACDGGYLPIMFSDDGQALNVGQTQRFHTARQRVAIGARDGGCVAGDCDRPPSWCEVHHINEFGRGGETSVRDGVLLCRHHHLMAHNNGWRVQRIGDEYWFVPPPGDPIHPEPILLETKSPAMRRLLASA